MPLICDSNCVQQSLIPTIFLPYFLYFFFNLPVLAAAPDITSHLFSNILADSLSISIFIHFSVFTIFLCATCILTCYSQKHSYITIIFLFSRMYPIIHLTILFVHLLSNIYILFVLFYFLMIYIICYASSSLFFCPSFTRPSIFHFLFLSSFFFYSTYLSSLQLQTIFPPWLFTLIILITIYLRNLPTTFNCSSSYETSISSVAFFYSITLRFGLFLKQTLSSFFLICVSSIFI